MNNQMMYVTNPEILWNRVARERNALKEFMCYYEWMWKCTMNMSPKSEVWDAERLIGIWLDMIKSEIGNNMDVAYMGVFTKVPHKHVHFLMLGKDWNGATLWDMDHERCAKKWLVLMKGDHSGVITPIHNMKGALGYIAEMNTPFERYELLSPYNKGLLEQMSRHKSK